MRLFLLFILIVPRMTADAQQVDRPDTLRLDDLRAAAAAQDPRAVQPELIARATRLRLAALRAQRLPQFALTGQATLQNEVPEVPIVLPGGLRGPSPPHEQYGAQLEADWTLYDGGRIARQSAAERAREAEEIASVSVTLYALREATTEAFFGALLSEAHARTLAFAAEDLEARLRVVRVQAEEGSALAAETAALEAERIRVLQQVEEAESGRRTALKVLADLTGKAIAPADVLAVPSLDLEVSRALLALDAVASDWHVSPDGATVDALLGRPELIRLARSAERAEAEALVREAQTRPSLSLFGQAGVGRPSPFNFFSSDVSEYGIAGLRVRWSIFDWGRARREAEAVRIQVRRAETESAAFARQISRDVEDDRANLIRLDAAIMEDERAVGLREEVLRVTRRQLDEGVLLPDIYTSRLTDLAEARLTLERHRIERARAQTRLLSALGHFPEPRRLPPDGIEDSP